MASAVNSAHWAAKARSGFKTSASRRSPRRGGGGGNSSQLAFYQAKANQLKATPKWGSARKLKTTKAIRGQTPKVKIPF